MTGSLGPSQTAPGAILVSRACRELRRELRPLAWAVLEDVALDAELEAGRLISRTSARRLAEHLGIDPGTAAGALRSLRQRQLLVLERESGPAGRFGLSVYVLGGLTGLSIASPDGEGPAPSPRKDPPRPAEPDVAEPRMEEPRPARPSTTNLAPRTSHAASATPARPAHRGRRGTAAPQADDQAILDFEWGTA